MKVTFDKNVYEFVVDPEKVSEISFEARDCYRKIHSFIVAGKIFPFISETILTYEVVSKDDRKAILSHPEPIVVTSDDNTISISSNPIIHSGNSWYESFYLPKAINMGFKVLPDRRFGKLINPAVKSSWYYLKDEDYFIVCNRFTDILSDLDSLNVGYRAYRNILGCSEDMMTFEAVKQYTGTNKKLSSALSERSDGDSVALHIANDLDFFCTNDRGKNAKHSVFSKEVCLYLKSKYNFLKGSPQELLARIERY